MKEQNKEFPRTLIISANSLSVQTNNGKMLASFFKDYPSDSLAQIYIWPEYPNSNICGKYFRITDMQILKSWVGYVPGEEVMYQQTQYDKSQPIIFQKSIKNWPSLRLFRDIIWLNKNWYSLPLQKFVRDFNPQIIFFLGLNNPTLYKMAELFSNVFSAPVIIYITDDYFLPRFSLSPAFHIRRIMLKNKMYHLLHRRNTELLVVNSYMRETYRDFFQKDSQEIFNCITIRPFVPPPTVERRPIVVSYIGNLLNNRTDTLKTLCKLLGSYPRKDAFKFEVYTSEVFSDKDKKKFTFPPYLTHCGSLDENEVYNKLESSDVLLHVESFAHANRKDTLLSFSTKLMEYMASGRPILMIGPSEIGSTRFLREHTSNITVEELTENCLFSALDRLLDMNTRRKIGMQNYNDVKCILDGTNSQELVYAISKGLLSNFEKE